MSFAPCFQTGSIDRIAISFKTVLSSDRIILPDCTGIMKHGKCFRLDPLSGSCRNPVIDISGKEKIQHEFNRTEKNRSFSFLLTIC